jgi:hypothetical protein
MSTAQALRPRRPAPAPLPQVTLRNVLALVKARRYLAARGVATDDPLSWAQWSSALRATGHPETAVERWRGYFEAVNPPRVVVGDRDGRMVELSAALVQARGAATAAAFNQALRALMEQAGRTQGQVERHDRANGHELSRSTISRMVNGEKLCSRPEQVEAFVRACGHGHEAALWVGAWRAVREGRRADAADAPDTALTTRSAMAIMNPDRGAFFLLQLAVMLLLILCLWSVFMLVLAWLSTDEPEEPGGELSAAGWALLFCGGLVVGGPTAVATMWTTDKLLGSRRKARPKRAGK